ncbi:unnamed protein product, partial [Rotaria sp. Silwood2]
MISFLPTGLGRLLMIIITYLVFNLVLLGEISWIT